MPAPFTPALADQILHHIAEGGITQDILTYLGVPRRTLAHWLATQPDFAAAYNDALASQPDALMDRSLSEIFNATDNSIVPLAKLRFEAAKHVAAKLNPTKWGDSSHQTITVSHSSANETRLAIIAELQALARPAKLIDNQAHREGSDS